MAFLGITEAIFQNLNIIWTFLLLTARYSALLLFCPGIGMGERGLIVRGPAVLVLAWASLLSNTFAPLPANTLLLVAAVASEFIFGALIGFVPLCIISGIQTAGQIASTTMGLGASTLIDPTLGVQVADISRIYGDVVVIIFLLLGGHHVAIYAASGLGGMLVPGTFLLNEAAMNALIARSSDIFVIGAMVAAPVLVALLLTQFVMGVISKAVPTVNIFIVSFPVTIGIGLLISALLLPELFEYVSNRFSQYDSQLLPALDSMARVPASAMATQP